MSNFTPGSYGAPKNSLSDFASRRKAEEGKKLRRDNAAIGIRTKASDLVFQAVHEPIKANIKAGGSLPSDDQIGERVRQYLRGKQQDPNFKLILDHPEAIQDLVERIKTIASFWTPDKK